MIWTNEEVALLTQMWTVDGMSASKCAAVLGVSRNAVIGKVHRLELPKRRTRVSSKRGVSWSDERRAKMQKRAAERQADLAKRNAVNPMVERVKAAPVEAFKPSDEDLAVGAWNALPGTTPIGMMDLTDKTCRWPIGDGSPYLFCGCETVEGSSYCATHKHIGTGNGTVAEQNAVKSAQKAAKLDRAFQRWAEAA